MTKILSLLRHAKSSWDDSVPKDFDRPLNDKGKKAATLIGRWLAREKIGFDHVIASPALRVVETIDQLAVGYGGKITPQWERKIYLASSATLMDVLRDASEEADHILFVGHNPSLEELALDLLSGGSGADAKTGKTELQQELEVKYPTGTYARINLNIDSWGDIQSGTGELAEFKRPRDLDPALGPDADDHF